VLVAPGLVRDLRRVEERPPRRRVHGTAEIARRMNTGEWAWAAPPAVVSRPVKHVRRRGPERETVRIGTLTALFRKLRWRSRNTTLLVLVPVALAAAGLLAI
jgi:hypothetical protein